MKIVEENSTESLLFYAWGGAYNHALPTELGTWPQQGPLGIDSPKGSGNSGLVHPPWSYLANEGVRKGFDNFFLILGNCISTSLPIIEQEIGNNPSLLLLWLNLW